jgi:cold shock CspA family protein
MKVPLEISFHGMASDASIETLVREELGKLERICNYIGSCRVAIEQPQKHQRTGNPYRVRIDMTLPPGHELVVRREPTEGNMHDTLPVVLNGAFKAARRQLQKQVERQRGNIKSHSEEQEAVALVMKLFPDGGYGFLKTPDGRELYFHEHSVLHGKFDRLCIGAVVRFTEEMGDEGPQASSLELIDKPGVRFQPGSAVETPLGWGR